MLRFASGEEWTTDSKLDRYSRFNADERGRSPVAVLKVMLCSMSISFIVLVSFVICFASRFAIFWPSTIHEIKC